MPIVDNDPRVYFAAERTLLAWLRTGITLMAFGFVIERFGLFLQLVYLQAPAAGAHPRTGASVAIGVLLVLLGSAMILTSAMQHRRFTSTLPTSDLPSGYSLTYAIGASLVTGMLGIALAIYLATSGD